MYPTTAPLFQCFQLHRWKERARDRFLIHSPRAELIFFPLPGCTRGSNLWRRKPHPDPFTSQAYKATSSQAENLTSAKKIEQDKTSRGQSGATKLNLAWLIRGGASPGFPIPISGAINKKILAVSRFRKNRLTNASDAITPSQGIQQTCSLLLRFWEKLRLRSVELRGITRPLTNKIIAEYMRATACNSLPRLREKRKEKITKAIAIKRARTVMATLNEQPLKITKYDRKYFVAQPQDVASVRYSATHQPRKTTNAQEYEQREKINNHNNADLSESAPEARRAHAIKTFNTYSSCFSFQGFATEACFARRLPHCVSQHRSPETMGSWQQGGGGCRVICPHISATCPGTQGCHAQKPSFDAKMPASPAPTMGRRANEYNKKSKERPGHKRRVLLRHKKAPQRRGKSDLPLT